MRHLNIAKLHAARLETDPFEYIVVPAFLSQASLKQINATYPEIGKGGSYPIELLKPSMAIKEVIDELDGHEFEQAVEEKFGVALAGKPKMYSLRGWLRAKDGQSTLTARIRSSPCCSISMRTGHTRVAGFASCAMGQTSKIS